MFISLNNKATLINSQILDMEAMEKHFQIKTTLRIKIRKKQ